MTDIRDKLRSGSRRSEVVVVGGVKHEDRCLKAAHVIDVLVALIEDALEDESDFETDWNKAARAALTEVKGSDG